MRKTKNKTNQKGINKEQEILYHIIREKVIEKEKKREREYEVFSDLLKMYTKGKDIIIVNSNF